MMSPFYFVPRRIDRIVVADVQALLVTKEKKLIHDVSWYLFGEASDYCVSVAPESL